MSFACSGARHTQGGVLVVLCSVLWSAQAAAQTLPAAAPVASPAPSPAATTRPRGLHIATSLSTTLIDQSTTGQGQVGPEAAGFIAGSPLSPNTPYDLFSSAPQTPGVAGIGQIISQATYGLPALDLSLTSGLGYVRGSITNASYWGENLMPTLNPHLGSQALPYAITFPAHAGEDDGTGFRLSILGAAIATADGKLSLRGVGSI